jgi:hypothetical protein
MGNAEEFSGQFGSRAPGTGRIRYAHRGLPSRVEPFCRVSPGAFAFAHREGGVGTRDAGAVAGDEAVTGSGAVTGGGEPGDEAWSAWFPVTGRRNDLWVLVCGGIATVAAFAAAFVASGGVASHPATPATTPAVVSAACPSPVP